MHFIYNTHDNTNTWTRAQLVAHKQNAQRSHDERPQQQQNKRKQSRAPS
jgi:hypothetical protein